MDSGRQQDQERVRILRATLQHIQVGILMQDWSAWRDWASRIQVALDGTQIRSPREEEIKQKRETHPREGITGEKPLLRGSALSAPLLRNY